MLDDASVCTPCCILLDVFACCRAKFETCQTFSTVQTGAALIDHCYMLRPFAYPVAFCWMLLGVAGQSLKPVKLLVPCKRAHYCWTTSPNIVARVLAVVCKRMQQLPTMLGPAVHRGKDTTHKSL